MTLVQAMRSDLPSVSASASLAEAAALMEHSGCQTLPVLDDQARLVGAISVTDLADRLGRAGDVDLGVVRDAMQVSPLRCAPDASPDEVRRLLSRQRQPAVLVMEDRGTILGAIDVYQVLAMLDASPGAAGPEPDYVQRVRGES